MNLTQPHLISSILDDLKLTKVSKLSLIPALSTKILDDYSKGKPFDGHFNYQSVIGKTNYLEKSTRLDLAYAVHQCARFCVHPKRSHGEAVKRIGRYLLETRNNGYVRWRQIGDLGGRIILRGLAKRQDRQCSGERSNGSITIGIRSILCKLPVAVAQQGTNGSRIEHNGERTHGVLSGMQRGHLHSTFGG